MLGPEPTSWLPVRRSLHGVWLTAPPVLAVGLRMDNETIQIDTGMCVGSSLSEPHSCKNCGKMVNRVLFRNKIFGGKLEYYSE